MIQRIEIFALVLSSIFCLKYLIQFILVLRQDDPYTVKLNIGEKILLYLGSSYILTSIIMLIISK